MFSFYKLAFNAGPIRFAGLMFLILMSSVVEGIGLAVFVPLLNEIGKGFSGKSADSNFIVDSFYKVFNILNISPTLFAILSVIVLMMVLKSVLRFYVEVLGSKLRLEFEIDLKRKLFQAVCASDWMFFLKQKSGDMINTIIMETKAVGTGYYYLINFSAMVIGTVTMSIIAVFFSWELVLMLIVVSMPISLVVKKIFLLSRRFGVKIVEANSSILKNIEESFLGIKFLKSGNLIFKRERLFTNDTNEMKKQEHMFNIATALMMNIGEPVGIFVIAVMLYITVTWKIIEISSFIVLALIFQRTFSRLMEAQKTYQKIIKHIPSYCKCMELLQNAKNNHEKSEGLKIIDKFESLEFKNVHFSYKKNVPVLSGLSLRITEGSIVALVGGSGGGKTTVVDMIARLVHSESGEALLNGVPLSEYDIQAWRNNIGYVQQESLLFHDTIKNNILVGVNNGPVSEDKIVSAARTAHAHDFITQLKDGYDTSVGDRGVQLSGGQRQRIALARALVREPKLLILDEATSGLDNESEMQIKKAINDMRGLMAVLIIAHRLTTVMDADYIYMIENGSVVDEGTPSNLMADKSGRFFKLYSMGQKELSG